MAQLDLTEEFKPVLSWLAHRFNPQRFFIFLSIVLFLVAWNRGIALMYGMVSLLLAILAVSYVLPYLNTRRLKVVLPESLQCGSGEKLLINLRLFSESPRQHISVSIQDLFPHLEDDEPSFTSYINNEAKATLKVVCTQRGEYEINQLTVSSNYPFGIHTTSRSISCSPCRLLVYPKIFTIHDLPIFSSRTHSIHGHQVINRPHSDEEYAGVREYRHGDNLKHVHWGASARHQEMIVREFESYDQPALLIILNCNTHDELGLAPFTSFETSIEIAASLMLFASKHGIAVELFAEGEQGFHLSLSPGETMLDYHLGQFAQMKADGSQSYWQQVTSICSRLQHIDTIVTFAPDSASQTLSMNSKNHIDIRFDQDSFQQRTLNPQPPRPVRMGKRFTYKVHWGNKLDRLFSEGY